MGRELVCTVRYENKLYQGKALLETTEILFRGDIRLKIPFASLLSTVAKDGELHLKWADGSAIFELGDQAAKWADKILHPKSTLDKLGIKTGQTISARAIADKTFLDELRSKTKSFSGSKLLKNSDLIFFGASEGADLAGIIEILSSLTAAGALWIVYPKGKQEIKEIEVLEAGRAAGLVDVKVVKVSETHTALKFVRPKGKR